MYIYLVEQAVTGLHSPYLTECVVVAETSAKALAATLSLSRDDIGFDLHVENARLTVTELGPLTASLDKLRPCRHRYKGSLVLSVATGVDEEHI